MAHPPQPPQLAQPPFNPPQEPPKKKHTARTVLIVIGSVFVVLIGISVASSGGDNASPGTNNPATAPGPAATKAAAPKATAPQPTTSAKASVAPPASTVACADQDDRSAPCTVTVGGAFALGKHQVLAGWKISDSGFGLTITGKAKNVSDDASAMVVTVKFLRGDEVMANVMCTTGELAAGQIETMSCLPDGTYTKKFDKVTAEAAF
ncbi:hypothetical protein [Streptomyces sp. SID13031]|uniref:hypothetical protein n=1 Tax=Streptomyces sp. SID13031 TaxID=2706046 RepID=UPI0013C93B29|nr:hypothetical protein [Streptomyces sp. SID13031]NEA33682.1 hypothetical protein [Streptomyces sp. SID13031]